MLLANTLYALTLPLRSAAVIARHPKLLLWAAIPATITLLLYLFLLGWLVDLTSQGMHWVFLAIGLGTEGWLATIASVTFSVVAILAGALTFSYVATIIAGPFCDFLAEATEAYTALEPVPATDLSAKARLFVVDLTKTLTVAFLSILCLLLSWIPVVGLAATVALVLLTAFNYLSYPQTRRGMGFREGVAFIKSHPFPCAAFGAATALLFGIPFFAWLALPLSVVGGTLLFARLHDTKRSAESAGPR